MSIAGTIASETAHRPVPDRMNRTSEFHASAISSHMLKEKRPACPVCCPDAESTVFAETGNPYYHSYATCSGMTNAQQGILVNALAAGLTRCPVCWTQTTEAGN